MGYWEELDKIVKRSSDRQVEGGPITLKVGSELPADQFNSYFIKTAFDLWQLDPNIQIDDAYWKLDKARGCFIKLYEGQAESHDHRWSVYADDNSDKVSVAYKDDTIATMNLASLGLNAGIDLITIKRSLLKLLSTKSGQDSILGLVSEAERDLILRKYPELS